MPKRIKKRSAKEELPVELWQLLTADFGANYWLAKGGWLGNNAKKGAEKSEEAAGLGLLIFAIVMIVYSLARWVLRRFGI